MKIEAADVDLLVRYDRLVEETYRVKEELDKFRFETGEPSIKWVGPDFFSAGYLGFREEAKEVFISDIGMGKQVPYDTKLFDIFKWFGVKVPTESETREQALSYLEWKKPDFRRDRIQWLIDYHYPLTEFKFWEMLSKVTMVPSMKDAWEEILDRKIPSLAQLYPEQWNKLVEVIGEFDVGRYAESLIKEVVEEMVEKYGHTLEDPKVAVEDLNRRAGEVFMGRVPPDSAVEDVYEQVKPLYPEKVEAKHTAMLKALRYAFLYPGVEVDSYASNWIFPMDFTTEEARAIASKILEVAAKRPPAPPPKVIPPPPPPPPQPEIEIIAKEAVVELELL